MRNPAVAVLVGLALLAPGCNEMKPEKPSPESVKGTTVAPEEGPGHLGHPEGMKPESALTDDQKKLVVAKVGDLAITLADFEARLNEQPSYARIRYNSLDKKKEFLDNLVEFELLALEAKRKGYDKDPQVVFAMKQEMIKKLMKQDMADLVKVTDVSDDDMRAYYDQNTTLYHKPEQVRASAIVLGDKAEADKVKADLDQALTDNPRRKRQTFNDFIKKRSKDMALARVNGDLGFFTVEGSNDEDKRPVPGAVAQAAFALQKINDVSAVTEADGNYFILMLTNRRPKVDKSFDEVKRQIQNKLFRDKKEEARKSYIDDLRAQSNVVVHEEELALIGNADIQGMMPQLGLPTGAGPGPDKVEGAARQLEIMRQRAQEKAGKAGEGEGHGK